MFRDCPPNGVHRFAYDVTDDGQITRMRATCKRCGQGTTAADREALDDWEHLHVCPQDALERRSAPPEE